MKKITLNAIKNTTSAFGLLSTSKLQKLTLALLLMVFFLASETAISQVYTLDQASGYDFVANVNKGRNAGVTPFAVSKNKSRVQFLYDNDDIDEIFQDQGTISHIGFNVTNLNSTTPKVVKNARLRIWVLSTPQKNAFKSSTSMSITGYPVPKVDLLLGDVVISNTGWYDIDFSSQAFFHDVDGTRHILVEFSNDNTLDRATQNFTVAVHQTESGLNYSRGRFTSDDSNTTLPATAASDLNSSSTDVAGNAAINMGFNSERKIRPDVRFTYRCSDKGPGGSVYVDNAGSGCLGAPVKLKISGASNASGLGYQWQSSQTGGAASWTNIAGATNATYAATTEMTVKYYRRNTFCVSDVNDIVNSLKVAVDAADWNTYNAGAWSKGYAPSGSTSESIIINSGTYTVNNNVTACSCMVNSSANLVVASGKTLTLTGPIVNGAGTITFENTAALMQPNGVINTGKVIYKRNSQPMVKYDFTYWSSPVFQTHNPDNTVLVAGTSFTQFSPGTLADKFFSWNNATQNWIQESPSNVMVAGKGYIIRSPQSFPTLSTSATSYNGEFKGVPFNGDTTAAVATHGNYSLIGNPFPSALDADAIINNAWNAARFSGTFYFWTHNSPVASGYANPTDGNTYSYNNDDYASYNLSGGTEGPAARYIGAGQSFMVIGKDSGGDLKLTNDMRSGAVNNANFYKAAAKNAETSAVTETAEKHRVWLQLANEANYKQVLVAYIAGATAGIDYGFDGVAMTGTGLGFYSLTDGLQLGIQGRSLPFDSTDQVPMGYTTANAGTHTVSMYNNDGIFSTESVDVFLEDNLTGVLHNLKEGSYTFSTAAGTFNNRFVLRYSSSALANNDFSANIDGVVVYKQQSSLHINSQNASLKDVKVFDLSGRMLTSKSNIGGNEIVFENMNWSSQVLIVQTLTDDNTLVTKKVVF